MTASAALVLGPQYGATCGERSVLGGASPSRYLVGRRRSGGFRRTHGRTGRSRPAGCGRSTHASMTFGPPESTVVRRLVQRGRVTPGRVHDASGTGWQSAQVVALGGEECLVERFKGREVDVVY